MTDPKNDVKKYKLLRNTLFSTMVPMAAVWRESAQLTDSEGVLRDTNARLKSGGYNAATEDYLKNSFPFGMQKDVQPDFTALGQPKRNTDFNPYDTAPEFKNVIGNELYRLEILPLEITPEFRNMKLTADEVKIANAARGGRMAKMLGRFMTSHAYMQRLTDEKKIEIIRSMFQTLNQVAENSVLAARRKAKGTK